MFDPTIDNVWPDGPSGSPFNPPKSLIRRWGRQLEAAINAGLSNGGLIYDTKASMDADLAHDANASAWVMTEADAGIYRKSGASGSGAWTKIASLPYSYIAASNVGAGAANAIQATTDIPVPAADGAALIALPIAVDNAASPVTVAFNGGDALTIKTVAGTDVSVGALRAGSVVAGYKVGSTFRLFSEALSLPGPEAYKVLAWNSTGTALENRAVAGDGTMMQPVYDPNNVGADAFDSANHVYTQAGAGGLTRPTILRFRETIHATEFVDENDTGSDDTAAFQLFLAALSTYKARGFVPAMTRPYWIKWIDQAYAKSMTVDLHNEAIIKGTKSFQDFSCDGSTASFAITDFDWYDHANGLNADLIDDSTGLVVQQYLKGTHYALIGNILDFTAGSAPAGAPAAGHMLKVSGVVPILYLRKGTGADRIDWVGGRIDCSERGYSQALPSGSGLTLRDWTRGSVFNADFLGAQSYIDARERRISDTGLGLNSVKNILVEGNYFRGWGDLGIYATGGASGGDPSDDGGSLTVHGNTFDGCNCGAKAVREMQGVIITGNKFTECATGVLNGPTGAPALESGTDYIVSDNIFRKTGRRAVDLRAMARGANVSGNRIIDVGCLPNGSPYTLDDGTLDPSPAAIVLSGCSQSKVQGNWLGFKDWAGDNNQRAIQISSSVYASGLPAYGRGIDVSGNYIAGFVEGITETGSPANLGPNIYTANRMLSVTTPMTITSGANWDYLDLSTGTRKFGRAAASWNEGANAWTPSLSFSNPSGTPTITYGSIRRGSYTRDPATGKLTIQFQVQATITHTETVAPLRLTGLPFMVPNADDKAEGIGVIRRLSGAIALPAGTVQVVMRALPERTEADVYFITNSSGSFSEIVLSGSLVSSGTTVVLYGVLEYLIN